MTIPTTTQLTEQQRYRAAHEARLRHIRQAMAEMAERGERPDTQACEQWRLRNDR